MLTSEWGRFLGCFRSMCWPTSRGNWNKRASCFPNLWRIESPKGTGRNFTEREVSTTASSVRTGLWKAFSAGRSPCRWAQQSIECLILRRGRYISFHRQPRQIPLDVVGIKECGRLAPDKRLELSGPPIITRQCLRRIMTNPDLFPQLRQLINPGRPHRLVGDRRQFRVLFRIGSRFRQDIIRFPRHSVIHAHGT